MIAKTYSAKPSDVTRVWYIVNAADAPLGRVATKVATLLTGKGKPMFTSHIDTGNYVVVINAAQAFVTGDKSLKKIYYRHSGFPGGLKERTFAEQKDLDATEVIFQAVRGMLPVNKLRDGRLARLKIYLNADHKHDPQKPVIVAVRNAKVGVPNDQKEGK